MAKRDGIHYTVHPTPKRKGETEQTYHVRRHYFTTLKSEDIVDHIRYHGSIVDLATYSLVMESLKEEIVELLQSGHDLHIEGLGRFCLQLGTRKTRGKDGRMHAKRYLNPEDITAREVVVKGISFTPDKAMRKLVAFEPGKKPAFDQDDDYHEIGTVTFPVEDPVNSGWFSATFPNPQQINHRWAYEPEAKLMVWDGGYSNEKPVIERECPMGAWDDVAGMTISFPSFPLSGWTRILAVESSHDRYKKVEGRFSTEHRLDMWEAKAGWGLRDFTLSTNETPVKAVATKTLVFGHVNLPVSHSCSHDSSSPNAGERRRYPHRERCHDAILHEVR